MQGANRVAFKKGQSGNPAGRPRRTDTAAALRREICTHADGIVGMLVKRAKDDGDVMAARLLLDRIIAPLKPIEAAAAPIPLPHGSALQQGDALLRAIAAGALPPGTGATLIQAVASLARVAELRELEARISKLEGRAP